MLTREDYKLILSTTNDELLVAYMMLVNSERLPKKWNDIIEECKRMPTKQMELIEILNNLIEYTTDDFCYIGFNSDSCAAADIFSKLCGIPIGTIESLEIIKSDSLATKIFIAELLSSYVNTSVINESLVETITNLVFT